MPFSQTFAKRGQHSMPHTPRIPDLPGELAPPELARDLRDFVAQLCHLNNPKYVLFFVKRTGSQRSQ